MVALPKAVREGENANARMIRTNFDLADQVKGSNLIVREVADRPT